MCILDFEEPLKNQLATNRLQQFFSRLTTTLGHLARHRTHSCHASVYRSIQVWETNEAERATTTQRCIAEVRNEAGMNLQLAECLSCQNRGSYSA